MNKILGITAEYDPFHCGHAYQIAEARRRTEPEAVICAMSGDFTQRGEPAAADKWDRARLAAEHGVDLVLELPFICAVNRADRFARGGVDLLAAAGATHISFGCEAEHPADLMDLARLQREHAGQLEEKIRAYMKDGSSRAKASELASREIFGDRAARLLLEPNNILAVEYLKRILWWEQERGVQICPVPVRRRGSGYKDADAGEGFAGGSAIRQKMAAGEDVSVYLPYDPSKLEWIDLPAAWRRLYQLSRGIILRMSPEELKRIYCVGEGLENRLLKVAARQESWEGFLSEMTSRRYTASAIRRIVLYILMNVKEGADGPVYGTVLAAGGPGRKLLREREDSLQLISNPNRLDGLTEEVLEGLSLDRRAADMFHLICGQPLDEHADRRRHPWVK